MDHFHFYADVLVQDLRAEGCQKLLNSKITVKEISNKETLLGDMWLGCTGYSKRQFFRFFQKLITHGGGRGVAGGKKLFTSVSKTEMSFTSVCKIEVKLTSLVWSHDTKNWRRCISLHPTWDAHANIVLFKNKCYCNKMVLIESN